MRFVFAILAFVVAATMIVLGLAQRTVFLGPSTYAVETTVPGDLPYTLISGEELAAKTGQQSLTVSGSDEVFLAYGRTGDVLAWLGSSQYNELDVDTENNTLQADVVTPEPVESDLPAPEEDDEPPTEDEQAAADALANPAGSDLWLAEYAEEGAVVQTISVPEDVSVLIASNGVDPAPDRVEVSWPLNNATPWAGPLIAGGILLLLVGLALYLLGIFHMRKSRGPRRKGITAGPGMEKMPKVPKPTRYKSDKKHGSAPKRQRSPRKSMIAIVPVALVSTLVLTGCSASFWPDFSSQGEATATPTPTGEALPDEEQPSPAVSAPQLERIVSRISGVTLEADAARDATLIATRFAGPALAERTANYTIRGKIADYELPTPIPATPGGLTLPQATETWPRTVLTVVHDDADATVAPTALVLVQQDPRSNYLVQSAVRLEPEAQIPDVAPATIGTAQLPPDSTFQILPPDQVAGAYADIITKGEESEFYDLFDAESDSLRAGIVEARAKTKEGLPGTATIEFSTAAGETDPVALATNESGAIVAVNIVETEVVKPVDTGAKIKPAGVISALSGVTETEKGVQSTYTDQLLFYVPPAGSSETIRLLGFSQALTKAAEL
ncbi:hypothetical protein D9V29_07115 [Mycetocola manganoxydans]|uniref:DUF8094 domain-containing protein n=1 Tax=Mycetocola manganoxydans TaxID=699879 RepID=A0A3L6ZUT7_9MICO|nr:hypothetical protein [Mycetocola manganoxydans]RLP71620.1 hypothetical protein D9V29_07115 [Mycetocola manganoxydans]GHD38741.1 hypothetical protein GCM10008097_00620 [Mycetocola manganoxydans]